MANKEFVKINLNGLDIFAKDKTCRNLMNSINLEKQATPSDGYSSTYKLFVDGQQVGDEINIPKDLVVESGSVKSVIEKNNPVQGYSVGDKYIDLVIANSNNQHIYILVSDLVDNYDLPIATTQNLGGVKIDDKSIVIDSTGIISGVGANFDKNKGEIFNAYSINTADGENSHAEGFATKANGNYSHAEGYGTKADGEMSHAENMSKALGLGSHSETSSVAVGDMSHSEGSNSIAFGIGSHAEGGGTTYPSITLKNGKYQIESGSHIAKGEYSHVEGFNAIAVGSCSHAEGEATTANGNCSHAEGFATKANGNYSHAEGHDVIVNGNCSHGEGEHLTIVGECSHGEGFSTSVNGNCSHAEGCATQANGNYSHASGLGTVASGDSQFVLGKFNIEDSESEYAVIIGNGERENRKNLITVSWDGAVYINNLKTAISETVVDGMKYQLGELTQNIAFNLPETADSDIEVDFAIGDDLYAINCEQLKLLPVQNTYYQVFFSYDKSLNIWFSNVISNEYKPNSVTVTEVTSNE